MEQYRAKASNPPIEWDITSSPFVVYHNYDVRESANDGAAVFDFAVDKMSQQEYNIRIQAQLTALSEISMQHDEVLINQYEAQVTQDETLLTIFEQIGGEPIVH